MRNDANFLAKHPSGIFYFRLIIPKNMRVQVGINEFRQSLRSRERHKANGRIYEFRELIHAVSNGDILNTNRIISQLRSKNTVDYEHSINKIVSELERGLTLSKQRQTPGPFIDSLQLISRGRTPLDNFASFSTALSLSNNFKSHEEFLDGCFYCFETIIKNMEQRGLESLPLDVDRSLNWFLEDWGETFIEMQDQGLIGPATVSSRINASKQNQTVRPQQNFTDIDSVLTLEDAWSIFNKALHSEKLEASTLAIYNATYKFLSGILGKNFDMKSLASNNIATLQDYLRKMPRRAFNESGTKKYFKSIYQQGGTLSEVIDFYTEGKQTSPIAPDNKDWPELLGAGRLEQQIMYIDKFFKWAYKWKHIEHDFSNMIKAGNLNIRKENSDSRLRAFSIKELHIISKSYIFSDYRAKREQARPVNFWTIVLSLYTGMRLEEIAQLRVDNIIIKYNIHCIDITEDEEHNATLKTKSSRRTIPIPDAIMDTGFMDYYLERKEFCSRNPASTLFFNFRSTDEYPEKFSDNVSKFFSRFRDSIGLSGDEVNFHSFRRTFIDRFKEADEPTFRKVQQIVGHAKVGQTSKYLDEYTIQALKQVLETVDYELPDQRIHWKRFKKKKNINWQYSNRSKRKK